jgi:biopolymer transport protein ExbB/TolQ
VSEVWAWFAGGGFTMVALGAVSAALCFMICERMLASGAAIRSIRRCRVTGNGEAPGQKEWAGLRRMGLIRGCVTVAPLLGLLGTVIGIVQTFESIVQGGYVTEMSRGIFKALRTTQYGLVIAACGLLGEQILLRRLEKLTSLRREALLRPREDE